VEVISNIKSKVDFFFFKTR